MVTIVLPAFAIFTQRGSQDWEPCNIAIDYKSPVKTLFSILTLGFIKPKSGSDIDSVAYLVYLIVNTAVFLLM